MIPLLLLALLTPCSDGRADMDEEDWTADPAELTRSVNEGELHFLQQPPPKPVHHHLNHIRIGGDSPKHGWVVLEQCHHDLDPVSATQIVYHPDRIRGLRILSTSGIGQARVEGPSIQLQDVRHGARLCLSAESQALQTLPDGCLQLRNGPYMRQFLDGYYPMRITLRVSYPKRFQVRELDPSARPGVQLKQTPGRLSLSAYFEGRLYTVVTLCPMPD
jgi:hypothetical protein